MPERARRQVFLAPLLGKGRDGLRLVNVRNGCELANVVVGAFDSRSRRKGLLSQDGLADGHALVIAPTSAIHTWFMRFAIDIAFVARDGRVLKTRAGVRPWRIAAAIGAYAAIEMPVGTLARTATECGDPLSIAWR
jgi:uncharacterized protein